eukprot:1159122-Pelagomonas_calceolata.AAC.3
MPVSGPRNAKSCMLCLSIRHVHMDGRHHHAPAPFVCAWWPEAASAMGRSSRLCCTPGPLMP